MEEFKNLLRSLTQYVCSELDGMGIPPKPLLTVVNRPDGAPYVAIDPSRSAVSDLKPSLSIGLLQLTEYKAVADSVQSIPELRQGIMVDAGGFLCEPEPTNITRALITNFLWRYLREGKQLDWDEARFTEIFHELTMALHDKSIIFHTTMPLSNLKMDIAQLDFGDALKLMPASIEELEQWINPKWSTPLGGGTPQWNTNYVDNPAVLHIRQVAVGQPRSSDPFAARKRLPKVNADHAITALRLVMNAPISVILEEHDSEGLMAFGGQGRSWGWTPPWLGPVATMDQAKAAEVSHVCQLLQTSPNIAILRLPLRRWESSLLRTSLEDRLIDAWISLEALLLGVREGELSFRAAMRLAELMGTSGSERKHIYDVAKISYDWRSVVVHGSSPGKNLKHHPLQDTVRLTTEYLRLALLKVLNLPDPFTPTKLEANLLTREPGSL